MHPYAIPCITAYNDKVPMLTSRFEYQKVRPQSGANLPRQHLVAETGLSTWGLDRACTGFSQGRDSIRTSKI